VTTEAGVSKGITTTDMCHRASTLFADLEMPESNKNIIAFAFKNQL